MGRLVDSDKLMKRLRAEIKCTADVIAKYINEDDPKNMIGTVKDGGVIGRLQGLQWCKNTLELDYYTVDAIPKDQYEARLKADMVSMLTEIQLEIEEHRRSINAGNDEFMIGELWGIDSCSEIIQQKINALKGEENEQVH